MIAAGVFNSGILANPVAGSHFNYLPASPSAIAYAQNLQEVLRPFGVTLEEAAIQFPLQHGAVKAVLVGCRSDVEVLANIAAFDKEIPESAWDAVKDFASSSGGFRG